MSRVRQYAIRYKISIIETILAILLALSSSSNSMPAKHIEWPIPSIDFASPDILILPTSLQ